MSLHTFDPKQVTVSFGGVVIQGFADGEFINIEMDDDAFITTTGADKQTTRVNTSKAVATATITLQNTSQSNLYLSGIHNADKIANAGALPLLVQDLSGADVAFAPFAYILKHPPMMKDNSNVSNNPWVFKCVDMNIVHGGTVPAS